MATFVLVHGAWHGGWCYDEVARLLRSQGHEVHTPTLTGLGERSHLMRREIGLDTHIQDILNLVHWQDLSGFVLCGHSYGGMIVTGVADAIPNKVASLVYLDAYLPTDGEAIWNYMGEERRRHILADAEAAHDGVATSAPSPAHFGVDPRNRSWVEGKMTPQPLKTLTQNISLSGRHEEVRRRVYVYASGPSSMQGWYPHLAADPRWQVLTMECGHDQMVDAPAETARILLDASNGADEDRKTSKKSTKGESQ